MRESSVSSSLSAAVVSMVSSFDSFRMRASLPAAAASISSWAFAMFMKDKSPESFADAERVAHLDVLLRRQVVGLVGHRAQKLGAGGVDLLAAGAQGERQNETAQDARHGAEQHHEGRRGGEDHELPARL